MSKYKCVIFDCDGVLVDSEAIGNQVLVNLANELGANINLDYAYQNFKGVSLYNCMSQIQELISENLPKGFEKQYRKQSYENFRNYIKPINGVKEVIENLNIPFCVASSGPESKIKLNLEFTGLLPYFENNIFSCYAIQKWKPDAAIFLWACETMGFQPNECVVIEDSLAGVKAGKAGCFDVFGYAEHDFNNELAGLADLVFTDMRQLPRLLED
ncbi:MAG: HAD-IA family hydrolase [Bacteroidota bacterium]